MSHHTRCSCRAALTLAAVIGPAAAGSDARLRSVLYSNDEVYRLHGYAGYQIDLEFDTDEHFVGLGSGDVEGLAFDAQDNHLFIKPKAINVHTNLTVLTTRHTYHFDYSVGPLRADAETRDFIYALRFQYPKPPPSAAVAKSEAELALTAATATSERNTDYWFCGDSQIQPLQAWDDGVHTHLRFNPRAELPALFVHNDDHSESLLNFSVERDEIVIHRIAPGFMVRRGKLVGCILNRGFQGSGRALDTGTVSSEVERTTRPVPGPP